MTSIRTRRDVLTATLGTSATLLVRRSSAAGVDLSASELFVPDGEHIVEQSIKPLPGQRIYGSNRAILKLAPLRTALTPIFTIAVDNVQITGLTVDGNRNRQSIDSKSPQDGGLHGICVYGAKNLFLRDISVINNYTDGLYIREHPVTKSRSSLAAIGIVSDNNRRQGMSVIDAHRSRFLDCHFLNTAGQKPEAGVDLEPNNGSNSIDDIIFIECTFRGNRGRALVAQMHDGSVLNGLIVSRCTFINTGQSELIRLTGNGRIESVILHQNKYSGGKISLTSARLTTKNIITIN